MTMILYRGGHDFVGRCEDNVRVCNDRYFGPISYVMNLVVNEIGVTNLLIGSLSY